MHRATASEVFGVPLDEVSSEQRRYAKVINFGLIYGMSAFGLAQQPGHRAQRGAATTSSATSSAIPGVKRYMDETSAQARASAATSRPCSAGACTCPRSRAATARAAAGAERQAINAPMQGTAADLIKLAMIAVQDALDDERTRDADDHAGARRTGVRGARRRARMGARPRCRA